MLSRMESDSRSSLEIFENLVNNAVNQFLLIIWNPNLLLALPISNAQV